MQQEKYDVVVVGSGLGGLGAGALLADRGYKTLVVEKLDYIGGRFSTYEYEGFKLSTGAMAIHRGGPGDEIFERVGAQMDLVPVTRLFYRLGGKDYEMPAKGSITAMLDIINKLEVDHTKLVGGLAKAVAKEKVMGALRKSIEEPEKETMTFWEWLSQYTDNELAHSVFDTMVRSLLGGHTYEIPARSVFIWFMKMGGSRDVGVAPHGNLANMEKLAKAIKNNDGDVWTSCLVKRIVVEGGIARGIVVQKDGSELELTSQVVISDVGPKKTVELVGQENFNEEYLRMMRLRVRASSIVVCHIAGDRPVWPPNGEPASLMITGGLRMHAVIPMTSVAPDLAPPGQHLTTFQFHPLTTYLPINKEEEERQVRRELNEQFPGYDKHGRILKIDMKNINDEVPEMHSKGGSDMPTDTPMKNLYNVGDGCLAHGYSGSTGAAESTLRVVDTIVKRFRPA